MLTPETLQRARDALANNDVPTRDLMLFHRGTLYVVPSMLLDEGLRREAAAQGYGLEPLANLELRLRIEGK